MTAPTPDPTPTDEDGFDVAVVSLAGRFPDAPTVDALWANIAAGRHAFRSFGVAEYLAAGGDPAALDDDDLVLVESALDGIDEFDARFFGYAPSEAARVDPQQRLFLQAAYHALELAGHDPARFDGEIGVYASATEGGYYRNNVLPSTGGESDSLESYGAAFANLASSLPTRVAYHLNLHGPAMAIQTGCSASLVAIHVACQDLLSGRCDLALAGGASLGTVPRRGYRYQADGVLSPDGRCRAFSADAAGMVGGDGIAVVALRRLDDALRDGDPIRAVIRGSATNNDGERKVGFTAPSRDGQRDVIVAAHAIADVDPATIGYVEAHGTGTPVGDPIEVSALTEAFRQGTDRHGFCGLGSLKSNIGHTDAAAGAAGLIKAVLALEHGTIPPTLGVSALNPEIDAERSPFFVPTEATPWPALGDRRRAAVSSFGIGGTNAHVVLEQAPPRAAAPDPDADRPHALLLSARRPDALDELATTLADRLEASDAPSLADAERTLRVGRPEHPYRRAVVARDHASAAAALRETVDSGAEHAGERPRPVVLLVPGYGAQHDGMGRDLYEREPAFRAEVDRCADLLRPHLDVDLRDVLYRSTSLSAGDPQGRPVALAGLIATSTALAALLRERGIVPDAVLGHSLGEYIAASIAGTMDVADVLRLGVVRETLVERVGGAMLAVPLPEEELLQRLRAPVGIAAVNGAGHCTVSGPVDAIAAVRAELERDGVDVQPIRAPFAAHSQALDAVLDEYGAAVAETTLHAPRIPVASNISGTWLTDEQATDPAYWTRHIRATVRFHDDLRTVAELGDPVLLELGPGRAMSRLARGVEGLRPVPLMRHAREAVADDDHLAAALARAWTLGAPTAPDVAPGPRVALPTYPFARDRHWIAAPPARAAAATATTEPDAVRDDGWRTRPDADRPDGRADRGPWLVVGPDAGVVAAALGSRGAAARSADALPDDAEALAERLRALHADGSGGAPRLVDLRERPDLDLLARAAELAAPETGPLDLRLVVRGAHPVTGSEPLRPEDRERAARALARSASSAALRVQVLDVADDAVAGPVDGIAAALLDPDAPLVALRGGRGWEPDPRPLPPAAPDPLPGPADLEPSLRAADERLRDQHPLADPDPVAVDGLARVVALHLLEWLAGRGAIRGDQTPTVDALADELGIADGHRRWLQAVLLALAADGDLRLDRDASPATVTWSDALVGRTADDLRSERLALEARLREHAPELAMDLDVLDHCAPGVDDVVRGRTDPAQLLFPDGLVAVYRDLEDRRLEQGDAGIHRQLVAETVADLAARAGRPLRVLEIGAGRGTLTWTVAEAVRDLDVDYHYTDLGRSLVLEGRRVAEQRGLRRMTFGTFDVSRDPEQQGLPAGGFDVVLAFNVLHATPDMATALRHAVGQLTADGLLLVLDLAMLPRDALVTAGLMEELWAHDDVRTDQPVADVAQWRTLLRDQGLEATIVAHDPESPHTADQHALLAIGRPAAERVAAAPLVPSVATGDDAPDAPREGEELLWMPRGDDPAADRGTLDALATATAADDAGAVTVVVVGDDEDAAALAARSATVGEQRRRVDGAAWRTVRWIGERPDADALLTRTAGLRTQAGGPTATVRDLPAADVVDAADGADREQAGRAFDRRPVLPDPVVAPEGERETAVVAIWEEVLGIRPVGVLDSFFDLGGESLLALQVVSRLRERLGIDVPLRTMLAGPTVRELVAAAEDAPDAAAPGPVPRGAGRGRAMRRTADGRLVAHREEPA